MLVEKLQSQSHGPRDHLATTWKSLVAREKICTYHLIGEWLLGVTR